MFKKCRCGTYTDDDEKKCPSCGENCFNDGLISLRDLVALIKKGDVSPEKIRTKRPILIYDALKASP